jgi:hypothetical protein
LRSIYPERSNPKRMRRIEMEKIERYNFTKDEVNKIFSDKIGKPVSRIRFSSRTQVVICEVGRDPKE